MYPKGLSTRDDLVVFDEVTHEVTHFFVHKNIGRAQIIPILPWKPGEKVPMATQEQAVSVIVILVLKVLQNRPSFIYLYKAVNFDCRNNITLLIPVRHVYFFDFAWP